MTGSTLPPITINRPGRLLAYWAPPLVLAPAVAVVAVMTVEGDGLSWAGVRDGLLTILGLVAFAFVVVAVVLRFQRRSREHLLVDAPAGTVFAAHSRAMRPRAAESDEKITEIADFEGGTLVIGADGISYLSPDLPDTRLGWSEIEEVEVCFNFFYGPHQAVLEARTPDGQVQSWLVPGAAALREALEKLRS